MGTKYNPSIVRNGLVYALDAANTRSYSGSGLTLYELKTGGIGGRSEEHTSELQSH